VSSVRTIIRDRIVEEFHIVKNSQSGQVQEFDIELRWLSPEETTRSSTYCVIVTDETRSGQTLEHDAYQLTGAVVLYAKDTSDARAKLDLMIEDAINVLRRAFQALKDTFQKAALETITTSEASTAEGDWPQAVIRWSGVHRRPVIV
jgi:hypothetical protein